MEGLAPHRREPLIGRRFGLRGSRLSTRYSMCPNSAGKNSITASCSGLGEALDSLARARETTAAGTAGDRALERPDEPRVDRDALPRRSRLDARLQRLGKA